MRVKAMWAPVVGLSICLIGAFPAAAQRGRGGAVGRAGGGGGMGQAGRPDTMASSQESKRTSRGGMYGSRHAGQSAPASQALEKNPRLSSRLQTLLPAGTNVQAAAAGFKNSGQFIAAVHVSHNLGIPFDSLKTEMLAGSSLGRAVRTLKPDLPKSDASHAVKTAETEARDDMKATAQRQRERKETEAKTAATTP